MTLCSLVCEASLLWFNIVDINWAKIKCWKNFNLFKEGEFSTDLVVRQFLYSDIYEDGLTERVEKEVEETRAYYEQKQQEK